MRRSRVPIADKRVLESRENYNSSQRKATLSDPKVMRKNFSVSVVKTRSAKENKMKETAVERQTVPAIEIDLETPNQSADEVERKTTESTPMPNAEEQEKKTIEFSPIDIVEDTKSNTPETIKDDSQTKRTSFTERIAVIVGMKPREKEVAPKTEKGKIFGTVFAIKTEANQNDDQVEFGATANHEATANNGATASQEKTNSLELGDLMAKLQQIDKKLKCSEEDRQMLKKEIRYKKNESLDNCFNLARTTEEKLQQMSDKVEAIDKESEKNIKIVMQEMKQRYDTVNSKLWSLETRTDTMSGDQAEKSCALQSKLDALLRNSITQDKLLTRQDDSDGCIDTWVEVMRLHLEQDNLNDERQACTAILSNLEGTAMKCVVAKKEEERDTADKIFEILLNRFGSGNEGPPSYDEIRKKNTEGR